MQTYQSTPDYYRDYIQHGWLKDQAAKMHKYIKRWKNEAGKWVYQYKKPKSNPTFVNSQASKELVGDGGFVNRYDKGHKTAARREYIKRANDIWRARNGYRKTSKSAMKSDSRYKRSKTNLTSQGYSGSRGSGENQRLRNLGTRRSSHDEYYWDETRMNRISDRQDINGGFKPPSAKKSTITKNKAPKKFQERMAKKAANSNKKMRHNHYWRSPSTTQNHIQPHRSRPSWTYKKKRK